MSSTHASWLADCTDRCVAELRARGPAADWRHYSNVAHQIAQARPTELREFVEAYPLDKAMAIAPLMVLAWRIVGNEFRPSMAARASEAISQLCDIDEWEKAVMAFAGSPEAEPGAAPDPAGM